VAQDQLPHFMILVIKHFQAKFTFVNAVKKLSGVGNFIIDFCTDNDQHCNDVIILDLSKGKNEYRLLKLNEIY
jgi:hypothetical protein